MCNQTTRRDSSPHECPMSTPAITDFDVHSRQVHKGSRLPQCKIGTRQLSGAWMFFLSNGRHVILTGENKNKTHGAGKTFTYKQKHNNHWLTANDMVKNLQTTC